MATGYQQKKPQLPNEFFIKTSNLPDLTKTHGKNKGVGNKQMATGE